MAWEYDKIAEQSKDTAGKWRYWVALKGGDSVLSILLKFDHAATDVELKAEAQKQIDLLNNPPVTKMPTREQLVEILNSPVATATEKINQIKAAVGI